MASCIFYAAFVPVYILILFLTIIIDYVAGLMIEKSEGKTRKLYLTLSIVANVSVLAVFKYYNFFIGNINELLSQLNITAHSLPLLNMILPIGLSFHTFQAMSYTIEVYRGKQKAEKHFGIYALYVMFYPQLVAGPIERPQNILHQFYEKHAFVFTRVTSGLKLMLWGLLMKVVIADRLAIYVNAVYNNAERHNGNTLILASVFFAFQIYCDFAGYSYIAIGSARVMGFDLMTNFNHPYFATSVDEFWKRWHISLSTWFRDYVYIPLGGNRVAVPRWYFNLFFVFLLSGLWHGANWTYVAWGALNGLYLIFAIITKDWRAQLNRLTGLSKHPTLLKAVQIVITFALITIAWVFFRANNISEAFLILKKMAFERGPVYFELSSLPTMVYSFMGILGLCIIEYKREFWAGKLVFFNSPNIYIRYATYSLAIIIILLFGVFDGGQFIYFQF
nr:MBOAT family O-acyltransferase [uncultured Chitinophaga sp.]